MNVEIKTARGPLVARFFPPRDTPKGGVVVAPAFGVPQQYYLLFARWLAVQGFLAVTFDYRGTGLSRQGGLRGFRGDILDWARHDGAAVLDELALRVGEKPLMWIGHSLGGQIFAFLPNRDMLSRVVTVATGSGFWLENSLTLRWRVWWLWYLVAPVSIALCGYFPGKLLGMVGDLPAGVMRQWRRWCLHPDYVVGVEPGAREAFASLKAPVTAISFTDDEMMSERNVLSIHGFYSGTSVTHRRLMPADHGLARVGHFGFFRADSAKLWSEVVAPELVFALQLF